MTNAFFDQGAATRYTGKLAICPDCGSAVAVDRKQLHTETLHPEPIELQELVSDGAAIAEVVEWDEGDPTA